MAKQQCVTTFQEALKAGYRVVGETTKEVEKDKRIGTIRLKNGSRPSLLVTYEADRTGYRFGVPQPV